MLKEKEDAAGGLEKDKSISAGSEMQNLAADHLHIGLLQTEEGFSPAFLLSSKSDPRFCDR